MFVKVFILFIVYLSGLECILHSFPVQYIGKELSVLKYKNWNICESRVCMRDSKKFIGYASLRNEEHPYFVKLAYFHERNQVTIVQINT